MTTNPNCLYPWLDPQFMNINDEQKLKECRALEHWLISREAATSSINSDGTAMAIQLASIREVIKDLEVRIGYSRENNGPLLLPYFT